MIDDSGMAHRLTPEDFILTPGKITKELADHQAAIVFGVTHPIIQRMLFYGEFNEREWWAQYNFALEGTPFDNSRTGDDQIEKISPQKLGAMRKAAARDRTLACFFENERTFNLLPGGLRQILDASGILSVIKSAILPLYKKRAKFLVE